MEHPDVFFRYADDARFLYGNIQLPGAVVVVEMDLKDLANGICAGIVFIRYAGILVMKFSPCHHVFVKNPITIMRFDLPEFYYLCTGYDSFCIFTLQRQS